MDDDPVAELQKLHGELDVLAQQFMAAESQRSGATGRDDTGMVAVTLTAAGQVCEVAIAEGWSRDIRPEHLGGQVCEAVASAMVARVENWGVVLAEQDSQPAPPPRPMPPPAESFAHQFGNIVGTVPPDRGLPAMYELLSLCEELNRSIDEATGELRVALGATMTGYNPSGHVQVSMTVAGELVAVDYDRRWLLNVRGATVGSQTVLAFQAAYRQQNERSAAKLIAESSLGELLALSQDPLELARRLRLRS